MKIMRRLFVISFLLISTTAQSDQLYYGLALINQQLTQEVNVISPASTSTIKETGSGLGIYADYFYKNKYRFNGTISYITYDDLNLTSISFAADYLFPYGSSFTLFTGVSAGGATIQFSGNSVTDVSFGSVYGVQAGAIAFISSGLMLEVGYRYKPANIETEILDPGTQAKIATSTVDELSETYINLVIIF